jgi:hypothetical protein
MRNAARIVPANSQQAIDLSIFDNIFGFPVDLVTAEIAIDLFDAMASRDATYSGLIAQIY